MEEFINKWGYIAVYLATTVEGELAYVTSIVTAKLGHMTVLGVAIAGFLGGMTRDSAIFYSARYAGQSFLAKRPKLSTKIQSVGDYVSHQPWWILVFHRYMYGFSTATLVVLANSTMTNWQFTLLCVAACFVWVFGLGLLGYYAAQHVMQNLDWLGANFHWILLGVVTLVAIIWLYQSQKTKN